MIALLTRKAFQVVNVTSGTHNHFESGNHLIAGSTESSASEETAKGKGITIKLAQSLTQDNHLPKIVPFAEHQIALCVERGADLTEATVTATALEAVLVPEHVQCPQQESILNVFAAART